MLEQTRDKNQSDKVRKSGQNAWDRTDGVLLKTESGHSSCVESCAIRATPGCQQ